MGIMGTGNRPFYIGGDMDRQRQTEEDALEILETMLKSEDEYTRLNAVKTILEIQAKEYEPDRKRTLNPYGETNTIEGSKDK